MGSCNRISDCSGVASLQKGTNMLPHSQASCWVESPSFKTYPLTPNLWCWLKAWGPVNELWRYEGLELFFTLNCWNIWILVLIIIARLILFWLLFTLVYLLLSLNHVELFATPWTIAHQAPLSMGSPGKNTRLGCHFLLQGIFLTQGLNPCLLHGRQMLYC